MQKIVKSGVFGLGLATLLVAESASAGLVSVTGGITAYSGPTSDHFYHEVNTTVTTKIQRAADTPRSVPLEGPLPGDPDGLFGSAGIGVGQLDLTYGGMLSPAEGIEFWQSLDDSKGAVNGINFTPAPAAEVTVGQEFLVGTFTFTNGGWFGSIPLGDGST
jgi:hypothetical protein